MAGLTAEGFLAETFQSLEEQIFAALRVLFGAGLPLDDSTIEGQSWKVLIEALVKLWELMETVYGSQDPDKATGAALDAVCALTGTQREPPSFGVGSVILTGDDATEIPSGSEYRIGDDGAVGVTSELATLALVDDYAVLVGSPVDVGVLASYLGNVYYVIVAGTPGGTPPTHTARPDSITSPEIVDGVDVTDNDVVWIWVGAGDSADEVDAAASETGPVNFPSFAIDSIGSPVIGWSGVGNVLDFEIGSDVQSDEDLRRSREANLAGPGTGTRDAIRAALLALDGVISVTVFVNNTDITDADGVPPHCIEALVRGGEDQDVVDSLLANVAAGIATFGTSSGFANDSEGTSHLISFSRPTEIDIYVAITLTKDPATYPDDGDDAVAQAIVDYGDRQKTGKDAVAQQIGAQANTVDDTVEVTEVLISTAPAPTLSTTIPITLRQLAVFDTSRIGVTSSDATP